jgi:beta-N-acetylhexosaminidase
MPGHLLCPALDSEQPATFSPSIIQGLLRQQLGFAGCVISDDLCMGALSQWGDIAARGIKAFTAGVDILLSGQEKVDSLLTALTKGINDGDISEQRAKEAVARILKLKERYPYQGRGDAAALQQEEDLAFSQELFQRVNDAANDPGDRTA